MIGAFDCSFRFDSQPGRFRMRLFEIEPSVEHKILLVSDYMSIFQSQIISQRDGKSLPATFASFDNGRMPNGLVVGWGMPQAYCLAHNLIREGMNAYSGTVLDGSLIPDRMKMLCKARSLQLQTDVSKIEDGIAREVAFWGVTPGHGNKKLERSDSCFLMGRLEVQGFEGYIPTKVYFVSYADNGSTLDKISEYQLEGSFSGSVPSEDLAAEITYDPGLFGASVVFFGFWMKGAKENEKN
jgi:hypothetical protein